MTRSTEAQSETLPLAPSGVVDSDGIPRFGTYRGEPDLIDYSGLAGPFAVSPWLRGLKHKRWQFAAVASRDRLAAFGIVDLGYAGHGFAYCADLDTGRFLTERRALSLPASARVGDRPGIGLEARFLHPGLRLDVRRHAGAAYRLEAQAGWREPLRAALAIDVEGAEGLSVVAPARDDGLVNFTLKRAGLRVSGSLTCAGAELPLESCVAGMDYSSGLLDRHTRWRWALVLGRLADGRRLGINLVEGFNQGRRSNENGLWLDGRLHPLPRVGFWRRKEEAGPRWQLRSEDGRVDLDFRTRLVRDEQRDLVLVRSDFAQALGTVSGAVRLAGETVQVEELVAIVEDQDTVW